MLKGARVMKHNLEAYLNEYETLTPTDNQVGEGVASTEWWSLLKGQFDDLIWLYFPQRTIFLNERFSPEDTDNTYSNIIKTFSIWLKSKKRLIDRLYVGYMADFNPLWNVDGVEGFVSKDSHTGTSTDTHTGDDKMTYEDNGDTTRSGSETIASSGTDTNTHKVTTFDDPANFKNENQDSLLHGKSDTHTYNSVKDKKDYDGFKNQNYDSELETTRDLLDEHVDLKIRQGNIGVTQSDKILGDAQKLYMNDNLMDLWKYIVRSCVNQVSYSVEGVD